MLPSMFRRINSSELLPAVGGSAVVPPVRGAHHRCVQTIAVRLTGTSIFRVGLGAAKMHCAMAEEMVMILV